MKLQVSDYISVDPNVCHGHHCFKGTRVMVYLVLELLEAGDTPTKILRAYPTLTRESIRAALRYAVELVRREQRKPSLVGPSTRQI